MVYLQIVTIFKQSKFIHSFVQRPGKYSSASGDPEPTPTLTLDCPLVALEALHTNVGDIGSIKKRTII